MPNVNYPASVKTDYDKLGAVYSLLEQMRLEHNHVGEIARSDWNHYRDKWYEYQKLYKAKLKELLHERNVIREVIWKSSFDEKTWNELSDEEKENINDVLYGNRAELKVLSTKATTHLLDELKAINLDDLKGQFVDPTEDYTTYTEVDPNGHLSKTLSKITWTDLNNSETAYICDDKGVDHFDGDFEFLFDGEITDIPAGGARVYWCGLANGLDDLRSIDVGGGDYLALLTYVSGGNVRYYLHEVVSGSAYQDYTAYTAEKQQWITFERDEAVGTYGTLYAYIYDDSDRTEEADTLSVTLHEKEDFRYIYGLSSYDENSAARYGSGYVRNLDLQEGGEEPTEKTGSDSGTGSDTKASGIPVVALSKSETGSGAGSKGSGDPKATVMKAETGSGVDALTSLLATQQGAETGSGVEASYLDIAGHIAKVSSDSGNGIETGFVIVTLIKGFETGSGAGALRDRALVLAESATGAELSSKEVVWIAVRTDADSGSSVEASNVIPVFFSDDTGLGYELSMVRKDIRGGDGGFSSEALKALIGTVPSGDDMRLHGRSGQVKTPSRRVRMPSKGVNI
jgi:hypothetical protein